MVENVFVKKNPLQDLLSGLNAVISTNERAWILKGHVTFKLSYNLIYQMKTTLKGEDLITPKEDWNTSIKITLTNNSLV